MKTYQIKMMKSGGEEVVVASGTDYNKIYKVFKLLKKASVQKYSFLEDEPA